MDLFSIAAQLLLGWLIADFLSGLVHWVEDRILWVGMPLISKAIVEPNRLHHVDPHAFLATSLLSRNSTTWAAALAIALPWLLLAGFSWIWLGAIAGGLAVTEVHAQAHRQTQRAGWYRALQEIGIVQAAPHHWGHHAGGMDTRYCILTGWLNPLLDRLRLWARLESGIEAIGLKPNRGDRVKTYLDALAEHIRLTILRLLVEAPGYAANDSVLAQLVNSMGLTCTRDQIRGHLIWLEEQLLVTRAKPAEGIVVATITERGNEVAAGRAIVNGVQRPSPGA